MAPRNCRKPQTTYKSPTAENHTLIIQTSSCSKSKHIVPSQKPAMKQSRNIHSLKSPFPQASLLCKPSKSSSLPLFHPLGRLAMSLPPLDPTLYGLPLLPIPDEFEEKPSDRSGRPPSKTRDAEEETAVPTVSSIAAVAAREAKERVSPRKRRTGGAKRKRKDTDDGDATYPAKRTRIPRGITGQNVEEDPLVDNVLPDDVVEVPDLHPDLAEGTKRRSTRAKGGLKRRDSSGSETTSISASANQTSLQPSTDSAVSGVANTDGAHQPDSQSTNNSSKGEEKEEGELSEDQTT